MQRFKDFTKKSGKVASAILSAAMVTSMVAGTNVVYAATETTEATTDVTATPTVNSPYEAVRAAKADLEAALQGLPVTTQLTKTQITPDFTDGATSATCLDDFELPVEKIAKQYGVTIAANAPKITTEPNYVKDGEVTVEYTISKTGTQAVTAEINYTVDSFGKRMTAAKAVMDKALKDLNINNTTADADITKAATEALKNATGGPENSMPLFADFDTTTGVAIAIQGRADATKTDDGRIDAVLKIDQFDASGTPGTAQTDNQATTELHVTIQNHTARMDAASKALTAYLQNDVRSFDTDATNKTFDDGLKVIADKYLAAAGYDDIEMEDAATYTKSLVKVTNPASQNVDGKALATFELKTKAAAVIATDDEAAKKETKDLELTIASDATKAEKMLADLMTAAAKVKVTNNYDEAKYGEELGKILDEDLKLCKIDSSKSFSSPAGFVATTIPYVYNIDGSCAYVSATVDFVAKDASANKDGDPKANFTVSSGVAKNGAFGDDDETRVDSYTYTIDSALTTLEKAKAAVEVALDNMIVTNDTEKADVEAVVNAALKDYTDIKSNVAFSKQKATATEEGTIDISVELTNTTNGLVNVVPAKKTITFKSNTFVVEDGKKVYYNKDGKTLKNTWLQSTESPDGYTYYIQNDGSVMQDRLTYHPDGEHVIYFDKDGHEVFDAFVNVKKDAQGQDVDYIGYFDTFGYAYVNQTTYGNGEGAYATDALFYINDYGVLENKGWFQNAAGEIGYAATNGTLTTSQWSLDQFGRKVYFQANGFLAKGLMTDGVKYYQLDENDGHLVGEF